ncbi:MAG: PQQ-binding-like beta-propeller repeat protein [Acidimicrobiales bacterium]|jgi:outer membrane protein assembly factor BamB
MALAVAAFSGAAASASSTGAGAAQAIRQAPPDGVQVNRARPHRVAAASLGDLLTYDYGNTRSGHDTVDPPIQNLSAKAAWDDNALDGAVYGEPLVYDATVYVGTEGDSVYAIAARTGEVLWRVHVGNSVPKSVFDSAPTVGCGDIDPLGITGTPVIDAETDEIFVAEETELAGQTGWQGIRHWLLAISLNSHEVLWHRDIDPPHANSPSHYFIAAEQQRPAITLANGRLYVAFGGLAGDCGQYHGYVVDLPISGTGPLGSYQVPTQREGAIWETNGAVVSPQGDLYVATGNGSSNTVADFDEGNSVVELSPTLERIGFWAPSDWVQLNDQDWDLGSAGPINVPGTSLLFIAGKPGASGDYGYLMKEGQLGGIGHGAYTGPACPGGGDFGANASDVIGTGRSARILIYAACGSGTEAFRVTTSPMAFQRAWSPSSGSPNGPPIVAGGLVWALDWDGAALYGMSPLNGHVVVRRSTDALDHFATPGVGDGMLFVPTTGGVEAFRAVG